MTTTLHALLDLQAHDTVTDQCRHRRINLPERSQLVDAERDVAAVDADIAVIAAERDVLVRHQKRAEDEAAGLAEKAKGADAKLYSGTITAAKELQSIQEEIDGLTRRQRSLEDDVLDMMVQIEPLDEQIAALEQRRAEVDAVAEAARMRITVLEAEIDAELDVVAAERKALADTLPPEILGEYESLRGLLGGVAVAKLESGSCRGCHLHLSAVDLDRIKKVPVDEIVHCEECGRILVR